MLIGKQKAIDFIKANEAPFWRLRRSENSAYLFTALGNASIDESMKRLSECIDFLEPGNYFLECSQKENDNRGAFKIPLRIEGIGPNNQQVQGIGSINGISPDEVDRRISEAVTRERERVEREEMQKRIKELETEVKEKDSELNSFMVSVGKKLEPYIGQIMGAFMPTPTPMPQRIAGIPQNTQKQKPVNEMPKEEIAKELNDRAEAALEKWIETDPECIDLLERIVKLSEVNPSMYQTAKNMLKSMA